MLHMKPSPYTGGTDTAQVMGKVLRPRDKSFEQQHPFRNTKSSLNFDDIKPRPDSKTSTFRKTNMAKSLNDLPRMLDSTEESTLRQRESEYTSAAKG